MRDGGTGQENGSRHRVHPHIKHFNCSHELVRSLGMFSKTNVLYRTACGNKTLWHGAAHSHASPCLAAQLVRSRRQNDGKRNQRNINHTIATNDAVQHWKTNSYSIWHGSLHIVDTHNILIQNRTDSCT